MAALTSLGVDVEAALDYGALGPCFRVSGILGMFIQLVGYHHHKSKHFGGYYGEDWGIISMKLEIHIAKWILKSCAIEGIAETVGGNQPEIHT